MTLRLQDFTIAISTCTKAAHWQMALALFRGMPKASITPKVVSYNATISSCEKGSQWQVALQLFEEIPQVKLVPDVISYNATISSCQKDGQWLPALHLFKSMAEVVVIPDAITYNATISSCGKSGQWQLALHLLDNMPKAKIAADIIGYTAAINTCEKGKQWQWSLRLSTAIREAKLPADVMSSNATISSVGKAGQWELAIHLFSAMPKWRLPATVISYNAVISSCEKGQQWPWAVQFLYSMSDAEVTADVISYNATISCCARSARWQLAIHFLDVMPEAELLPNVISFNGAISSCEKGRQWQLAVGLFKAMPKAKILPNVISYNATISSCEKGAQWQLAIGLLHTMPDESLAADVISYSAAISSCEKDEQWQWALHLFTTMDRATLHPELISYNAVISSCENGRKWQLAAHLFARMPNAKVVRDIISYNATISSSARGSQWQLATHLYHELHQDMLHADAVSYNATTSACVQAAKWQLNVHFLDAMQQHEVVESVPVETVLADVFLDAAVLVAGCAELMSQQLLKAAGRPDEDEVRGLWPTLSRVLFGVADMTPSEIFAAAPGLRAHSGDPEPAASSLQELAVKASRLPVEQLPAGRALVKEILQAARAAVAACIPDGGGCGGATTEESHAVVPASELSDTCIRVLKELERSCNIPGLVACALSAWARGRLGAKPGVDGAPQEPPEYDSDADDVAPAKDLLLLLLSHHSMGGRGQWQKPDKSGGGGRDTRDAKYWRGAWSWRSPKEESQFPAYDQDRLGAHWQDKDERPAPLTFSNLLQQRLNLTRKAEQKVVSVGRTIEERKAQWKAYEAKMKRAFLKEQQRCQQEIERLNVELAKALEAQEQARADLVAVHSNFQEPAPVNAGEQLWNATLAGWRADGPDMEAEALLQRALAARAGGPASSFTSAPHTNSGADPVAMQVEAPPPAPVHLPPAAAATAYFPTGPPPPGLTAPAPGSAASVAASLAPQAMRDPYMGSPAPTPAPSLAATPGDRARRELSQHRSSPYQRPRVGEDVFEPTLEQKLEMHRAAALAAQNTSAAHPGPPRPAAEGPPQEHPAHPGAAMRPFGVPVQPVHTMHPGNLGTFVDDDNDLSSPTGDLPEGATCLQAGSSALPCPLANFDIYRVLWCSTVLCVLAGLMFDVPGVRYHAISLGFGGLYGTRPSLHKSCSTTRGSLGKMRIAIAVPKASLRSIVDTVLDCAPGVPDGVMDRAVPLHPQRERSCVMYANKRYCVAAYEHTGFTLLEHAVSSLRLDLSRIAACTFHTADLDVQGNHCEWTLAVVDVPVLADTAASRARQDFFVLCDIRPLGLKPIFVHTHVPKIHVPSLLSNVGIELPSSRQLGISGGTLRRDYVSFEESCVLLFFVMEAEPFSRGSSSSDDDTPLESVVPSAPSPSPDAASFAGLRHTDAPTNEFFDPTLPSGHSWNASTVYTACSGSAAADVDMFSPPAATVPVSDKRPAPASSTLTLGLALPSPGVAPEPSAANEGLGLSDASSYTGGSMPVPIGSASDTPSAVATETHLPVESSAAQPHEPTTLRAFVYVPDVVPEVHTVSAFLPCSVDTALAAVAAARVAADVIRYPQLIPVCPQPFPDRILAVSAPSWLTNRPVVLLDCQRINQVIFAKALHPRLSRESLLLAIGQRHDSAWDIYVHGLLRPLSPGQVISLCHGMLLTFVPGGCGAPATSDLAIRLMSSEGWEPEADVPGLGAYPGQYFWVLTDAWPVLFEVGAWRRALFDQDLARHLQVQTDTLFTKPSHPRVIDGFFEGHLTSGLIVATPRVCRLPCPPARVRDNRLVIFIDARPVMCGFLWLLMDQVNVPVSVVTHRFIDDCPAGYGVSVSGAEVDSFGDEQFLTLEDGLLLTVDYVEYLPAQSPGGSSSPPPDQDDEPGQGDDHTSDAALPTPASPDAPASRNRSRSPRGVPPANVSTLACLPTVSLPWRVAALRRVVMWSTSLLHDVLAENRWFLTPVLRSALPFWLEPFSASLGARFIQVPSWLFQTGLPLAPATSSRLLALTNAESSPSSSSATSSADLLDDVDSDADTAASDEESEPTLVDVVFVLLAPDYATEEVVLQLLLPQSVSDAFDVLDTCRGLSNKQLFPTLCMIWPQPDARWAVALMLPEWIQAEIVCCFDLARVDGRVFAVRVPRVADSYRLLLLAGLALSAEVDIFVPLHPGPLAAGEEIVLTMGDCVSFAPAGSTPEPSVSLREMLGTHLPWMQGPAFPLPVETRYCLVSDQRYCDFVLLPDRSFTYRADIASRLGLQLRDLLLTPAANRVQDAAFAGRSCRTVIAVGHKESAREPSAAIVCLLDCRPLLQGWYRCTALDGWLDLALLRDSLSHSVPEGWALEFAGCQTHWHWRWVEPGDMVRVTLVPMTSNDPSRSDAAGHPQVAMDDDLVDISQPVTLLELAVQDPCCPAFFLAATLVETLFDHFAPCPAGSTDGTGHTVPAASFQLPQRTTISLDSLLSMQGVFSDVSDEIPPQPTSGSVPEFFDLDARFCALPGGRDLLFDFLRSFPFCMLRQPADGLPRPERFQAWVAQGCVGRSPAPSDILVVTTDGSYDPRSGIAGWAVVVSLALTSDLLLPGQFVGSFAGSLQSLREAGEEVSSLALTESCRARQLSFEGTDQVNVRHLPTWAHLHDAFRHAPPHKAAGPDLLPPALCRVFSQRLTELFWPIMMKAVLRANEAVGLKGGVLHRIAKPNAVSNTTAGFRGILVQSCLSKVLHRAVRHLAVDHWNGHAQPMQIGGRQGCPADFGQFCSRAYLAYAKAHSRSAAILFVDISAAYYGVIREAVLGAQGQSRPVEALASSLGLSRDDLQRLQRYIDDEPVLRLQDADDVFSEVANELHRSTWFLLSGDTQLVETFRGTRPGGSLADIVFNILFSKVLDRRDRSAFQQHVPAVPWSGIRSPWPAPAKDAAGCRLTEVSDVIYADDLASFLGCDRAADLPHALSCAAAETVDTLLPHGLNANVGPTKTAAVVAPAGPGSRAVRGDLYGVRRGKIPVIPENRGSFLLDLVPDYKHLGSYISHSGCMLREIRHRLAAGRSALKEGKQRLFACRQIPLTRRVAVFKAHVLSAVLSGVGTWPALNGQEAALFAGGLLSMYRQLLCLRVEGGFSCTSNQILDKVGLLPPLALLHLARLRFLGQLVRNGPDPAWALLSHFSAFLLSELSVPWVILSRIGPAGLPYSATLLVGSVGF
ncbi:unnamed protein product [Symbiodinium microadriaticum]|nr:unnamed protein product [Symbiodinium microadriaticum]